MNTLPLQAPAAPAAPIYHVKLGKSKQLLDDAIGRHNATHQLCDQLRPGHRTLMEKLLWIYGSHLRSYQAYTATLAPGAGLPPLSTNNVQLSKAMGCTPRTIINLITRLRAAGIIQAKKWRGTHSSYMLWLSPQVVWLETPAGHPTNATDFLAAPEGAPQGPPVKTFRHTVSSNPLLVTSKSSKLSGTPHPPQGPESPACGGFPALAPVDIEASPVDNRADAVDKSHSCSEQGTPTGNLEAGNEPAGNRPETAPPVAAAPPAPGLLSPTAHRRPASAGSSTPIDNTPAQLEPHQVQDTLTLTPEAPTQLHQVLDRMRDPELAKTATFLVNNTLKFGLSTIWADAYVCPEQHEKALACLAEYFLVVPPKLWKPFASQVRERFLLVQGWVQRRHRAGQVAFVPVSAGDWLDQRNPRGFVITEAWLAGHLAKKAQIKDREILTKAIRQYTHAHLEVMKDTALGAERVARAMAMVPKDEPCTFTPNQLLAEVYRRLTQRLNKRNSALLQEFHHAINKL